jgi:Co/Zn/Cd efflux system component
MSDAFHMLFDNFSLAVGLIASVIGRWQGDAAYTFGYVRAG